MILHVTKGFLSKLDTVLEAAMKGKPKSLIHMGRNIPKVRNHVAYVYIQGLL